MSEMTDYTNVDIAEAMGWKYKEAKIPSHYNAYWYDFNGRYIGATLPDFKDDPNQISILTKFLVQQVKVFTLTFDDTRPEWCTLEIGNVGGDCYYKSQNEALCSIIMKVIYDYEGLYQKMLV